MSDSSHQGNPSGEPVPNRWRSIPPDELPLEQFKARQQRIRELASTAKGRALIAMYGWWQAYRMDEVDAA